LNGFLCKTRENKLITGYGGIGKYYGYNSEGYVYGDDSTYEVNNPEIVSRAYKIAMAEI